MSGCPWTPKLFKKIEDDPARTDLGPDSRAWIADILLKVPLLIGAQELKERVFEAREWYRDQIMNVEKPGAAAAEEGRIVHQLKLFDGWREPTLRRAVGTGQSLRRRAFPCGRYWPTCSGEMAKNFRLIRHPEEWMACVTASQRGDRCVELDFEGLPSRAKGGAGAGLGTQFRRLRTDEPLAQPLQRQAVRLQSRAGRRGAGLNPLPDFQRLAGSNFFRGLALIDLAEAMLKRAFGADAVATRVNAAGQGDFFQVHLDRC